MATVISRRYEVLSKLGEGGMGVVYKVRHTSLETILALKVLPSYLTENQEMVGRFSREGRVMARLSHRNIVRVIDFDRDDNLHYLVMEYIQGKTLKQYVHEKGPLFLPEVIEITQQVAGALAYAHNHAPQVIHRDIKPANIMIEDDSGRAVVMDFGIAKELGESELTKTGVMVGTLKYCSPEQMRHEPLDGSADIYSLGMVIYEMYTGEQFFAGLDEHAVIGKVLYDPEDNVPRFNRGAPPAFVKLLTRAIAKHRQDRYQRAEELLRDLDACRSETEGDETATIIWTTPEKSEPRGEPGRGEIEDIEEQIRELEEEKRRRLLSTLQTEARQAREKAARDGAPERAAALFQEGLAAEESAGQRARGKDYTLAQEAYQEAIRLFNKADEEALAVAVLQKAEQERREMEAAKAEAERYGAREKGRAFYPRGLARQAQADELWEQKNYQQAAEAYREARRFFDDARELAYREMVKGEAETARAQALTAKEMAESERAEDLAPEIFQEALLGERRADTAMEQEEFTQARELYVAVRQQYVAAQERAHREQQHQRALALQQEAKDARRQADEQEAQADCPAGYQKAAEAQQRGEQLLAAHEYAQAALEYAQAQSGYQQAGQEAEHARRRRAAERARQQAHEAQAHARQAGAQEHFAEAFAQTQRLLEQGQESEAREDFAPALSLYEQAAQRLTRLRQDAVLQAARAQAEAARQSMVEARAQSQALREWAETRWAEAQQWETRAAHAAQEQDYPQAAAGYTQARQVYEQARQEAEREQLRHEVLEAQQQAHAARVAAENAEAAHYAAALLRRGMTAQEEADLRFQEQGFRQAAQQYRQASTLFAQAAEAARQERAQEAAAAARQHAEQAQARAQQTGAATRFAEAFAQAREGVEQGRACEARQDFAQAVERYAQAAQHFAVLRDEAAVQGDKEQAEAVRQRAAGLKQELATLTEWLGATWVEAQGQEKAAEQAWQARHYQQAAEQYAQAAQSYEAARVEAEEERLRHRALTAKDTAERQRVTTEQGEAAHYAQALYRQAVGTMERARQHFAQQQWAEAAQEFVRAQEAFAQALQNAQREKAKQAAAAARQRLERARTQAERAGAQERLGDAFAQAQRDAEHGRENEAREEFTEALRWYEQAAQRLAQLRREAGALAAREEAEAARQQMEQVRERVQPLRQWAEALWAEAQEWETRAEQAYQAQDYEQAAEGYEQARQRYERVGEEGKRERQRQEAGQARQQAEGARAAAEVAEAARYAEGRFGRGTALLVEAARRESAAEFIEAAQGYRQAEALFHEAAEEARREQARRAAGAARQRMEAERAAAEEAGAQKQLAQEFAQAQTVAAQGRAHEERQEFTQAVEEYTRAAQRFGQLRQEALRQAERERAEAARQHAAEEERQRQHAREAQGAAEQQRVAAEQGEAARYAQTLYQQAIEGAKRGEQRLARKQWAEAAQEFVQAQELFTQALQSAQREKAKQAAATAREKTVEAQHEADKGAAFFPEQLREANSLFLEASRALAHEDYNAARAGFERSAQIFLQISRDALVRLQQEQAEQAKARTQELQSRTLTAKGRQKKRADKALVEGERLFQQGKYAEAQARYEEAASLLAALQPQGLDQEKTLVLDQLALPGRDLGQEKTLVLDQPALSERVDQPAIPVGVQRWWSWIPRPWPRISITVTVTFTMLFLVIKILQFEGKAKPPVIPPPQESPRVEERPPVPSPVTEPKNQEEPPPSPPQERVQVTPSPQPEPLAPDPPQALVKAVPPPELEPPVLKPPLITQAVPEATVEVAVAEGERLAFAVDAQSVQQSPLRYTWLLDGKKQAEGKKWTYRPDFDEGGEKPKEVKAVVTDGKAAPVEKTWQVRVQDVNRPPVIDGASPKVGPVEISASEQRSFAIQAADPDKEDRLTYVWSLDGQEVARGSSASWQLPASAAEAAHKVTVDVVDKAGKSKQAVWNVTPKPSPPPVVAAVQPREKEVPPPLSPPREPPKVDGPERRIEVTEKEIQDWLESYRQAWEDRNIPALVKLGAISSQEASDLQRIFAQYPRDFRVALKEVENRREGKQAKVAFTQVDIFDGKPRPHPRPKTFTLEKETDGHIIGRR